MFAWSPRCYSEQSRTTWQVHRHSFLLKLSVIRNYLTSPPPFALCLVTVQIIPTAGYLLSILIIPTVLPQGSLVFAAMMGLSVDPMPIAVIAILLIFAAPFTIVAVLVVKGTTVGNRMGGWELPLHLVCLFIITQVTMC